MKQVMDIAKPNFRCIHLFIIIRKINYNKIYKKGSNYRYIHKGAFSIS